jgi:lipid-A-disaccharide synthase
MPSYDKSATLLVVAGEPSGDRMAARVVRQISTSQQILSFGIGGAAMEEAGVDILTRIDEIAAVGVGDTAFGFKRWIDAWSGLREAIKKTPPGVALLVDAPEFNLPLARILTEAGTRVVFYVAPQIWAWRSGRDGLLARRVDVLASILPFEKTLLAPAGVNVEFVGHPILDEPAARSSKIVRDILGIEANQKLVALLPGSRQGEIARHQGPMLRAGELLNNKGICSVFAPPRGIEDTAFSNRPGENGVLFLPSELSARDLLGAADAALVASGTATLEAAVAGVPMAVVYRLDRLSWLIGRLLVRVPYVGLPNWIAKRQIVPELLQDEVNGEALYRQAGKLLENEEQVRQRAELASVADSLGTPGAAGRVAALVMERFE